MAHGLEMSSVSEEETFWFKWRVENVHLSDCRMDKYFSTPTFKVALLQDTVWALRFAPAGIDDPLHMGCSLSRMNSEREQCEPEIVKLRWNISVIAEGGTVRFRTCIESFLKRGECEKVPRFMRKSDLLPSDTPQNNLTIYCEMKNDPLFSSRQDFKYDLEALSSDLRDMLESGFRSDFTIHCRWEIFKVHKFILISRWPEFCKRFEIDDISTQHSIDIHNIKAATFRSFLSFLYSGKLQREDISMELCMYMHEQYCDILIKSLETPVSNLEFVTHMHCEWKHLTWEVGDANVWKTHQTPFFRVIPLEVVYPNELVIIFSFDEIDGEEWLKLDAKFTGLSEFQPLLLDGEICFINKDAVVCSRKFTHLMEHGDQWCFPQLVKKHDLLPNERNSKCIEISLCICDGDMPTRQVSANINNASSFREVKDLHKLMMDLIKSPYEKDFKLKFGDRVYDVHSLLVAARSEKLRKLIQDNVRMIEIKEYMTEEASNLFIRHLYGDSLFNFDITDIVLLNNVAKKYLITSLERMTRRYLEQ